MARPTLDDNLKAEFAAIAESSGCELLDARFRGGTLQIVLDHPEAVTLDHCQMVSKQVSAQLDVLDWGPEHYTLEVTSPGLDRELFRRRDYERFAGARVRVTFRPAEGKRTVVGTLERFVPAGEDTAGADAILLAADDEEQLNIPLHTIDVARLVPEL